MCAKRRELAFIVCMIRIRTGVEVDEYLCPILRRGLYRLPAALLRLACLEGEATQLFQPYRPPCGIIGESTVEEPDQILKPRRRKLRLHCPARLRGGVE